MRPTSLTPYLPLPRDAGGTPRAPVPRLDSASGGFTFERLRGGVRASPPPPPPSSSQSSVGRPALGSSTTYSAVAFVVAFVVYLATGFACLAVSDGYLPHDGIEALEGARCVTAYRNAHHAEVRLYVGTPPRAVRLLVRLDISKACATCGAASNTSNTSNTSDTSDTPTTSVVLLEPSVLHSTSVVCDRDSTTCADVAIVSRWRDSEVHNELRPLRFLYGAQHLAGLEASQLGLDGEISLCRGVSYVLSSRQLCAIPTARLGPTSPTSPTSCAGLAVRPVARATIGGAGGGGLGGLGAFVTSACALRAAGPPWAETPAANPRCASCTAVVDVFPAAASVTRAWLTFAEARMFDVADSSTVGAMRETAEAGGGCAAHSNPEVVRAHAKLELSCATAVATGGTAGTACGRPASVSPLRVSGHRVRATVDADGAACFGATPDPSLHANVGSGPYRQPEGPLTAGEAWLRLLLMIFAAAIVWVRREDTLENADRLFVRCVQIAAEGASRTIVDVDAQTRALGLGAALARLTLATTRASSMSTDGQTRVVATECIAASLSIVHWFVLYGGRWMPSVQSLKDAGLRPALGGSSAIVDVTCATMMAFASPPVRGDVDSFDVIARLLTTVLLCVACITRCLLSAACSGVLTQRRFNADAICSANALALSLAFFWWFQAASIAVVIADLFATPVSIDWSRESTGSSRPMAVLLFTAASLVAAPRLTANAVAITTSVEEEGEGGEGERKVV